MDFSSLKNKNLSLIFDVIVEDLRIDSSLLLMHAGNASQASVHASISDEPHFSNPWLDKGAFLTEKQTKGYLCASLGWNTAD